MASLTHTHVRTAKHRRSELDRVSGEQVSRGAASSEERDCPSDWPTDPQVWNWAESAALSGYGPAASSFL
ncbi:hypothetical protein GCM10011579_087960 [Streptomyces albiflavescens]|uniref:Uncharacterized protein n=1 Tax=Streptomyces albiflavescens TaxID=1623582 RepID=A0A917YDW7_9ACTN|nr:hypothetical protein [Streptomyces albiflavescens]GGN91265.1 hypothetical protein GCM10011579_087960 [Streptomyces albiflavescens]